MSSLPAEALAIARPDPDLAEVRGQETAKRALEIAAAGGHHVVLIGPPSSGKTMLAHRLWGLLPPLAPTEAEAVERIYGLAGEEPEPQRRPFRCPEARIGPAAMMGERTRRRPGEVSLAHAGVLLLDALAEYRKDTLAALRRLLDQGEVSVTLAATMHPCPCGRLGDPRDRCGCTRRQVERYRLRVALLDRFALQVGVPAVSLGELRASPGESSSDVARRVAAARAIQAARFGEGPTPWNGAMGEDELARHCRMDRAGIAFFEAAATKTGLSIRARHQVLAVARTVADLAAEPKIRSSHLAEALQYRAASWVPDGH